jgi:hypothetical protein
MDRYWAGERCLFAVLGGAARPDGEWAAAQGCHRCPKMFHLNRMRRGRDDDAGRDRKAEAGELGQPRRLGPGEIDLVGGDLVEVHYGRPWRRRDRGHAARSAPAMTARSAQATSAAASSALTPR